MFNLKFYDANSGIHSYTINGDVVRVAHQEDRCSPVVTVAYSSEAAILMSLSILRRLAPSRLAEPERALVGVPALPAVVVQFPRRRVLVGGLEGGL